jgi:hypothetical protein
MRISPALDPQSVKTSGTPPTFENGIKRVGNNGRSLTFAVKRLQDEVAMFQLNFKADDTRNGRIWQYTQDKRIAHPNVFDAQVLIARQVIA